MFQIFNIIHKQKALNRDKKSLQLLYTVVQRHFAFHAQFFILLSKIKKRFPF